MKLGGIGQNPIEHIAGMLGMLPQPLLDTHIAMLLARTVMEGARLGVFETLKDEALTAAEVAARCGGQPRSMGKLLGALAGCEYLRYDAGRYSLAPVARKWMLGDAAQPLGDKMLLQFLEWNFLEHIGDFVRTGKPLDLHARLTPEEWGIYQRGMRATAVSCNCGWRTSRPVFPSLPRVTSSGSPDAVALCSSKGLPMSSRQSRRRLP